jgi:hypothetical protein
MKRSILSVDVKPDFKKFIEDQAKAKKTTPSKLVKAALKKILKFKEKELV